MSKSLCPQLLLAAAALFLSGQLPAQEPQAENPVGDQPRVAYHLPSLPTLAVGGSEQVWSDELVFHNYRI